LHNFFVAKVIATGAAEMIAFRVASLTCLPAIVGVVLMSTIAAVPVRRGKYANRPHSGFWLI
jgi:hypothetical protein